MPAITRRTWANLRDEVIRRSQGIDATGFSARVEHALWSTYLDLCTQYHHFELDKTDTSLTLSTSVNTLSLPSDCYIVVAMKLRDASVSTTSRGFLAYTPARDLIPSYQGESAVPTRYTRFGNTLWFNSLSPAAHKVDLYYYRLPTAPDFSGTFYPDTSVEIDEHLIQGALGILFPSLGRPDLTTGHLTNLQTWLALQVRPAMVAETPAGKRERFETPTSHGGQQG